MDKLLLALQAIGIPLLLALLLAATGRSVRGAVRAFALVALVLLVAGMALRQYLVMGSLPSTEQTDLGLPPSIWWLMLYIAGSGASILL